MFLITLSCTNLKRQLRKNSLAFILCAVIVCFLCSYIGNIQANQKQLSALPDIIPVSAFVSNLSGSMNVGLEIKGSLIDGIEASGFVRDMVCTVQTAANFAPETPEQRVKPKKIKLAGINDIAAYPSVKPDNANYNTDLFKGHNAKCIVNRYFMKDNGLSVGDEIELDIYRFAYDSGTLGTMRYEYLIAYPLTISGSFDSSEAAALTAVPDIIAPIGWLKSVFAKCNVDFYADSASFAIKNPAYLNEFKAAMKELTLLPVNHQAANAVTGNALVVNDETFVHSASSLKNNLLMLRLFFPFLISAVLMTGYVVSNLMFQSRREEYAVMRSIGVGKSSCLAVFLMESVIPALSGVLVGAIAAVLFADVAVTAVPFAAALFFAAYMLGVFTAILALGRISVISLLSKAD